MIRLTTNNELCTTCGICTLTCSFVKEKSISNRKSRIHISVPELDRTIILYCTLCGDCIAVCPEEALHFNQKTGAIILNKELCNNCGICFDACSSGYLKGDPDTGQPLMCDLCNGKPECAENCPTKAIEVIKKERGNE